MADIRLIARLDVKGPYVIKGVHLEGLRKVGDPNDLAKKYFLQGADEIIYMDSVASLYGRNNLLDIVRKATAEVFIPITVGGGLRSVEDVREALCAGADKIAINTAAVKRPKLISEVSQCFGSQCMVLSIEAKKVGENKWEAYTDNGREKTGLDAVEWALRGYELGAGEILLTSVDMEGTAKGFDYELVKSVTTLLPIPVIASGGMGEFSHLEKVVTGSLADAVAMAHVLHYEKLTMPEIRGLALANNLDVRRV